MIFLLDLPEPIHGMSNVNQKILKEYLGQTRKKPYVLNTSPSYASSHFGGKLWGGIKLAHSLYAAMMLFFFFTKKDAGRFVYRPINGGAGQVYDIVFLLICRVFKKRVFIHHHSFKYLNNYSALFRLLLIAAGSRVEHVVLGEEMKKVMVGRYHIQNDKVRVLSNIAFFDDSSVCSSKRDVFTLGYLSNICFEKGIGEFLDLCDRLKIEKLNFNAIIAGPFIDSETQDLVLERVSQNENVSYIGPQYGESKELFFRGLDCFFFPSKYKNEAEPMVLYEAAQYGCYLMGARRGCMEHVISSLGGATFADENIVDEAFERIVFLLKNKGHESLERDERKQEFFKLREKERNSLNRLIIELKRSYAAVE